MHLLKISLLLVSMSSTAFARGPYLPENNELNVMYGSVIYQTGFDRDSWYEDVYWDEETDGEFHLITGKILLKVEFDRLTFFELAQAVYRCSLIDDGAYGAMDCDRGDYLPMTAIRYRHCELDPSDEQGFSCW